MMTTYLPQELLEEILCRVPATSLNRLRTTCKQWNCLFNDKKFSEKHLDKSPKQCLALTLTEDSRVCLLNVNLHNRTPSAEFTGELSLIDSYSNSNQVKIRYVSHCDGLLLCSLICETRIVVWNPCTGETKWIQTRIINRRSYHDFFLGYYQVKHFVLGYYQENKSCDKSYKILSYKQDFYDQEFELYDINSNSWRNLEVPPIPNYHIDHSFLCVSLKGKTYWIAYDSEEEYLGLISFDYTTERFERQSLPYSLDNYATLSLSVVGEEKLAVLLQRENTSREEIWVTNKIDDDDETKKLLWSKILEVTEYDCLHSLSFLVDEKKNIVVRCERPSYTTQSVIIVSNIVGEDNETTKVDFPVKTTLTYYPFLFNYVPSLIQIEGT